MQLVLLIWEGHAVLLLAHIFITTYSEDFEYWFQRDFLPILRNTESDYYHLWWCKFVLYYWLLPATTFPIVFTTPSKLRRISDTWFNGIYLGKILIIFEIELEHLFHILYSNYSKLLQRVGIFRVQPGILEVGLVKNTRELGKL